MAIMSGFHLNVNAYAWVECPAEIALTEPSGARNKRTTASTSFDPRTHCCHAPLNSFINFSSMSVSTKREERSMLVAGYWASASDSRSDRQATAEMKSKRIKTSGNLEPSFSDRGADRTEGFTAQSVSPFCIAPAGGLQ